MPSPTFSDYEKARLRRYLGFSELFHDLDPRLEGIMSTLGNRSPDAVVQVQAILVDLADVDSRISDALDNLDLIDAEEVKWRGPEQLEALRDQGRMKIQQIAITFELVPKRDYYQTGGDWSGVLPL